MIGDLAEIKAKRVKKQKFDTARNLIQPVTARTSVSGSLHNLAGYVSNTAIPRRTDMGSSA
jgi:hypothetical protein